MRPRSWGTHLLLATATVVQATRPLEVGSELFAGVNGKCHTATLRLAYKTTFSECVDTAGLINLLSTRNGSITKPFNRWLQGFCSGACSSRVLNYTSTILDVGCHTEINNEVTAPVGIQGLAQGYHEYQELFCLRQKSDSKFCIIKSFEQYEKAAKAYIGMNMRTPSDGLQLGCEIQRSMTTTCLAVTYFFTNGLPSVLSFFASAPIDTLCTDCNKGMANIIASYPTGLSEQDYQSNYNFLGRRCGQTFVDGEMPSSLLPFSKKGHSSGSPGATTTVTVTGYPITKTVTVTATPSGTACARE